MNLDKFVKKTSKVVASGSTAWVKDSYKTTPVGKITLAGTLTILALLGVILSSASIIGVVSFAGVTAIGYSVYISKTGFFGPVKSFFMTKEMSDTELAEFTLLNTSGEEITRALSPDDVMAMKQSIEAFEAAELSYVPQSYPTRYTAKIKVEHKGKERQGKLVISEDSIRVHFWLNKKLFNTAIAMFIIAFLGWALITFGIYATTGTQATQNLGVTATIVGIVFAVGYAVVFGALWGAGARVINIGRIYAAKTIDINEATNRCVIAVENRAGEYVMFTADDITIPEVIAN